MKDYFNLASTTNLVSFPFRNFKNSYIFYQILMLENQNLKQAMLLKTEITSDNSFILVGYSTKDSTLIPVNYSIALNALELIKRRLNNIFTDQDIDSDMIDTGILTLQKIANNHKEPRVIQISPNLFIFTQNEEYNNNIKVDISFKDNLVLEPKTFNFIGYKGSEDYIETTFENIDDNNLKYLHLLNHVKITFYSNENNYTYTGLIYEVNPIDNSTFKILMSGFSYNLKKSKINFTIANSINPFNILSLVLRSGGMKEEQINIEGYEKIINPYTIVIPIRNLIIEEEKIGIGNVGFYPYNNSLDEINNAKEILKEKFSLFQADSFARLHIDAESPYDAYILGKAQIEKALDIINHLIKQDNLLDIYTVEENFYHWSRDNFNPKPLLTSLVYIHNAISQEVVVTDMEQISEPNKLTLGSTFSERLSKFEWYEELVMNSMDNETDLKTQCLFYALKWLKRSWDSDNFEDSIIFSNISIEFLLSQEKVDSIIKKSLRRSIVKAGLDEFKTKVDSQSNIEELEGIIKEKMSSSLSSVPLMTKLEHLINRLSIPIDESDMSVIKNVRKLRNDLVHGRGNTEIDRLELWKMNTLIGMIIAYEMQEIA